MKNKCPFTDWDVVKVTLAVWELRAVCTEPENLETTVANLITLLR